MGGEICLWGGQVGDRNALMGSVYLSTCSVVLTTKSEKWQFLMRMQGKVNYEEVKSTCLEGGSIT